MSLLIFSTNIVYTSSQENLTSTENSAVIIVLSSMIYFVSTTVSTTNVSISSFPSLSKTLTLMLLTSSSLPTTSTPLSSTTTLSQTPPLSSPTIFSPILAGVIGGAIVAVVCIIVCLLMIVVRCVKKKVHYPEADGGATLGSQTSSTMKIEQRSNPAYSTVPNISDPTYDSATEMQTNVAYASTNFNATIVDASYSEVDTYDIIQEESNDDYI